MVRIKIRKSDSLFSEFIKKRDGWVCKRCFKQYQEGDRGLQNSHFWGRGNESTRFEPLNCDSICFGCHQYFHANPFEYTVWKKRQLGKEEFDLLEIQKNTYKKRDDALDILYIQKLIDDL